MSRSGKDNVKSTRTQTLRRVTGDDGNDTCGADSKTKDKRCWTGIENERGRWRKGNTRRMKGEHKENDSVCGGEGSPVKRESLAWGTTATSFCPVDGVVLPKVRVRGLHDPWRSAVPLPKTLNVMWILSPLRIRVVVFFSFFATAWKYFIYHDASPSRPLLIVDDDAVEPLRGRFRVSDHRSCPRRSCRRTSLLHLTPPGETPLVTKRCRSGS